MPVAVLVHLAGLGRVQEQVHAVHRQDGSGGGLRLVCTLGGAESAAPMQF